MPNMKQVYLVPNIITAFGLACGLYVIFKANLVGEGTGVYEVMHSAALLIILASLADFLDGAVARALHAESEFGFMFDSLADAITFGVAPAVLLIKCLTPEQGTGLSFFVVIGAMLYSLCGVLRLVRFNVKTVDIKYDKEAQAKERKNFTGLPIPAAALAAISAALFFSSPQAIEWFDLSLMAKSIWLTSLTLLVGFLMVSRIKFPSLKALHVRVPSLYMLIGTVILAIFVLYGLLHRFALAMAAVSWGYILIGILLLITKLIIGKKSDVLKEFQPESESDEIH